MNHNYNIQLETVHVPEVPFSEEMLTGSGAGAGAGAGADGNDTGLLLTPMAMSNERISVIPDEQVGQLYAYRINNSAVVLGTRRTSSFGASIGIELVAQGKYRCIAENSLAKSEVIITISLQGKLVCSYMY